MYECIFLQFLDGNVEIGVKILPDCLNLLRFCGSPQKYASDHQASDYTLVHLPQTLTKYWVQAVLIILYKVSMDLRLVSHRFGHSEIMQPYRIYF